VSFSLTQMAMENSVSQLLSDRVLVLQGLAVCLTISTTEKSRLPGLSCPILDQSLAESQRCQPDQPQSERGVEDSAIWADSRDFESKSDQKIPLSVGHVS
jgi:hypothetical protein